LNPKPQQFIQSIKTWILAYF